MKSEWEKVCIYAKQCPFDCFSNDFSSQFFVLMNVAASTTRGHQRCHLWFWINKSPKPKPSTVLSSPGNTRTLFFFFLIIIRSLHNLSAKLLKKVRTACDYISCTAMSTNKKNAAGTSKVQSAIRRGALLLSHNQKDMGERDVEYEEQ